MFSSETGVKKVTSQILFGGTEKLSVSGWIDRFTNELKNEKTAPDNKWHFTEYSPEMSLTYWIFYSVPSS